MIEQEIRAPAWLRKRERAAFDGLIRQRNALGKPVLVHEVDALADLASARQRIVDLHRLLRGRNVAYDMRRAVTLHRLINATSSAARKLAGSLGL